MEPSANQPGGVPMLLGCHWRAGRERQFQRAAELGDGFISISDTPEEFALVADKVRHYAGVYGRDFEGMESAFYMTVNMRRDRAEAAEEANRYLLEYYGANIWGDRWGLGAAGDDCAAYSGVCGGGGGNGHCAIRFL